MNIFSSLHAYAGKWSVSNSRKFNDEEIAMVTKAEVVPSQYGSSVCFFMKNGQMKFIPLSSNSSLKDGDLVNLQEASLITLSKEGEEDIIRIEA